MRVPVKVFGDLRAQLAACHIAEAALIGMAARYGNDKLQAYMTELVDYAERMTRAALSELPDGVYDFLDHIDDDGIDVGVPIPLKVTLTKTGDRIHADWTGTRETGQGRDQQHALLHQVGDLLRHPLDPAAEHSDQRGRVPRDLGRGAAGHHRQHGAARRPARRADSPGFAWSIACSGRWRRCCPTGFSRRRTAAIPASRSAAITPTAARSSMSISPAAPGAARPDADGLDGNSNIYANMASQPIEVTESEQPLQITAYEFIQDAMGPGKFRGGAPFRREYKLLAEEAILQVRSDRRDFRPYGLYGGGPGKPSMNYLNPDRNPDPLPSKLTMNMKRGDLFRHEVAGAGGWGDPLERDPALVLKDVRNEFVSERAAREDYGVMLAGEAVDERATATLRQQMRDTRNWGETPVYSWGNRLAAE